MPGLGSDVVEHRLLIKKRFRLHKQPPRNFAPKIVYKIKEEVIHLLAIGFIITAWYVKWLFNVVPVKKKNEKLRVCIDFRNLNIATPKNEYQMPMADILINSTSSNEIKSLMDGHLGYNQIFITEEDVHKTAFQCLGAIGTFKWLIMPFGLKNARAIYQRALNLFSKT